MYLVQDLHKLCKRVVPKGVMYSVSPTASHNRAILVLNRVGTPKSVVSSITLGRQKFDADITGSLEFHQSSQVSLPNGPYTKDQFLVMVIDLGVHLLTEDYV
jgi:hypothetical protein